MTLAFTDTSGNNVSRGEVEEFFASSGASASDYLLFEIVENAARTVAWCSQNAAFYRQSYLSGGDASAASGSWNKWRKAPITGNVWQGPDTASHLNTYGSACRGPGSWCSESFPTEPRIALDPAESACEVFDEATGQCGGSAGASWQVTLRIGPDQAAACGF